MKDEGTMGFLASVFQLSRGIFIVAGIALTFLMMLTVTDVLLRILGRPIVGIFELVAFSGAIAVGFSVPLTSWVRGHIYVDFLVLKFPPPGQKTFHLITRALAFALFFLIGWNLFKMGTDLWKSGEVSATLQMPFFPIVYAVGAGCWVQCLVLVADVVKIMRGKYE